MTPDDLDSQLGRLEAAWGAPKDRTDAQMVAMTRGWFAQLERFGVRSVEAAFTHVIGTHKFQWAGAIVEIVAFCTKDDSDWRDALGMRESPRYIAPPVAFERDGRSTEEEIQHRVSEIAAMKRDAGFNSAPEITTDTASHERVAASQSASMSSQLRNSCAARRARKQETCNSSCARQSCWLRERGFEQDTDANQFSSAHTASEH